MKKLQQNLFDAIKVAALAAALTLGANYLFAWTNPPSSPPSGNVAAPLNVSSTEQTKAGPLTLGSVNGGNADGGSTVGTGEAILRLGSPTASGGQWNIKRKSYYGPVYAGGIYAPFDYEFVMYYGATPAFSVTKDGALGVSTDEPSAGYKFDVRNGPALFEGGAAVSNSFAYADGNQATGKVLVSDSNGNATWGGFNTSFIKWTTVTSNIGASSYQDTGLQLTVTPKFPTDKFVIIANINANNGSAGGDCTVGLFKDSTALAAPFASYDNGGGDNDASTVGVTYVDTAGSMAARTYIVRGYNCYFNASRNGNYTGASTMTVLELP